MSRCAWCGKPGGKMMKDDKGVPYHPKCYNAMARRERSKPDEVRKER